MAQGYATIANNGNYIASHFISGITSGSDTELYTADTKATPAFDPNDTDHNAKLARNVSESMMDVAAHTCALPNGQRCATLDGGRQVATKTGTAQFGDTGTKLRGLDGRLHPAGGHCGMGGQPRQTRHNPGNYFNGIGPAKNYDIYGGKNPVISGRST